MVFTIKYRGGPVNFPIIQCYELFLEFTELGGLNPHEAPKMLKSIVSGDVAMLIVVS